MSKRVSIGDRNLLFHIWDTAGQEKVCLHGRVHCFNMCY